MMTRRRAGGPLCSTPRRATDAQDDQAFRVATAGIAHRRLSGSWTFWLYAAFAVLGIFVCACLVPETDGRPLEDMGPCWTNGRHWPGASRNGGPPARTGTGIVGRDRTPVASLERSAIEEARILTDGGLCLDGQLSRHDKLLRKLLSYCQDLRIFSAAAGGVSLPGRSTSFPLMKMAPARIRATRYGA